MRGVIDNVALAAMVTVPLPVPPEPAGNVSQEALEAAVHAQPLVVVTVTVVDPPDAAKVSEPGESVKVQSGVGSVGELSQPGTPNTMSARTTAMDARDLVPTWIPVFRVPISRARRAPSMRRASDRGQTLVRPRGGGNCSRCIGDIPRAANQYQMRREAGGS